MQAFGEEGAGQSTKLQICRMSKSWRSEILHEVKSLSRVQLFATQWTVTYQTPPSMGFSRQECWSGLPFPSPGDLPRPGTEPASPVLAGGFFTTEPLGSLTPCMLYSGVQKSTATHVLRRMYTSDNVRQTHELTYLTGHESTCPHLPKFES